MIARRLVSSAVVLLISLISAPAASGQRAPALFGTVTFEGQLVLVLTEGNLLDGDNYLYATDGTPRGTEIVAELPDFRVLPRAAEVGGAPVFVEEGQTGTVRLFTYTSDGLRQLLTVPRPVSAVENFRDGLLMTVDSARRFEPFGQPRTELWVSDRTSDGTRRIPGPLGVSLLQVLGERAVFWDFDGALWSTDGTVAGTWTVADLQVVQWVGPTPDGDAFFVLARVGEGEIRFWVTDGTEAGTRPLSAPGLFAELDLRRLPRPTFDPARGLAYFLVDPPGAEPLALWELGLDGGRQVADPAALEPSASPRTRQGVLEVDGRIFLWFREIGDGGEDSALYEIVEGAPRRLGVFPGLFSGIEAVAADGLVFFMVATEPGDDVLDNVEEVWVADSSSDSARFYADLCPGRCDDVGAAIATAFGTFVATGGPAPNHLLRLDPEGPFDLTTAPLADASLSPVGVVGRRLVFGVSRGRGDERDIRFWSTDGTLAGAVELPLPELTGRARGLLPPLSSSVPDRLPLVSPQAPGFRFWIDIEPPGQAAIAGTFEEDCIPETLCVSGALPGRTEAFVRVIGPRPNGLLWPVVTRFTPSRVQVWIEQVSTGDLRYYDLPATDPDGGELSGLFDRDGFVP